MERLRRRRRGCEGGELAISVDSSWFFALKYSIFVLKFIWRTSKRTQVSAGGFIEGTNFRRRVALFALPSSRARAGRVGYEDS